jgi:hypothetical protein
MRAHQGDVRLVPTERGAMFRLTFPQDRCRMRSGHPRQVNRSPEGTGAAEVPAW